MSNLRFGSSWVSLLIAFASACSAEMNEHDLDMLETGEPAPELSESEDIFVEWQRAREGQLSEDERQTLSAMFAANGIREDRLTFEGRLVALDGDGIILADDLLSSAVPAELIPKGRVHTDADMGNANLALCSIPGEEYPASSCPRRPVDQADVSGGTMFWKRPDTTKKYYVVATLGTPAIFTGAGGVLTLATTKIQSLLANSATGDCLNLMFQVRTQAQYDALPSAERTDNYEIFVRAYGPSNSLCGPGAVGCAMFPRNQHTFSSGTRLAFGPGVAFRTTADCTPPTCTPPPIDEDGLVNDAGPEAVGIVVHELLHAMGLAHMNASNTNSAVVPGTPATVCKRNDPGVIPDACGSVMWSNAVASNPNWNDWDPLVPLNDQNMLRKLYGPGDASCAYTSAARSITACGPNGILSGTDLCCAASCGTCGGSGCSGRPGGSGACCTSSIRQVNRPCGPNLPPCIIHAQ